MGSTIKKQTQKEKNKKTTIFPLLEAENGGEIKKREGKKPESTPVDEDFFPPSDEDIAPVFGL